MKAATILVTGATGRTGQYALEYLTRQGAAVRAFVHHEGPKAESLRALGVDVVIGDLFNMDDIARALDGIHSAYFCYPIAPRLIDATSFFAAAARERGVKAIVNISQISARRDSKSHAAQQHWVAERIFDWSGIPTNHLRPTFFAEWLLARVDPDIIRSTGALKLPMGYGRHAPIASEDLGRLIAAILQDPNPHVGKTYPVYGQVEMNHYEIAQAMGRALGRGVHYEPITFDQFLDGNLQGLSEFGKQHLSEVTRDYQNGGFSGRDGIIKQVTGQSPMTVEAFIEKNRSHFA
jgi:NAD(P)H dehydrogenase (quinone)